MSNEINKPFYERTLRAPRTINPDRLARAKRAPRLSPVGAKRVMADKTRTIELHHLKDNPHDKGIIVASWDVRVKGIDDAAVRDLPITSISVRRWLDRLSPRFRQIAMARLSECVFTARP